MVKTEWEQRECRRTTSAARARPPSHNNKCATLPLFQSPPCFFQWRTHVPASRVLIVSCLILFCSLHCLLACFRSHITSQNLAPTHCPSRRQAPLRRTNLSNQLC